MQNRPHKRLSITAPTAPAATDPEPTHDEARAPGQGRGGEKATVRVMAYLTEEEAEALDELWLKYRRRPEKPSKSDILRAAFQMAQADPEGLTDTLAGMRDTTAARQRDSKAV